MNIQRAIQVVQYTDKQISHQDRLRRSGLITCPVIASADGPFDDFLRIARHPEIESAIQTQHLDIGFIIEKVANMGQRTEAWATVRNLLLGDLSIVTPISAIGGRG